MIFQSVLLQGGVWAGSLSESWGEAGGPWPGAQALCLASADGSRNLALRCWGVNKATGPGLPCHPPQEGGS